MLQATGNTDPGQLDRRITLKSVSVTRDAVGGKVESITDVATVWAMRRVDNGRRFYAADQETTEETVTWRIRYRTGLAAFMRVAHGNDVFEIVQKPIELGRRAYLDLVTRSVRAPAATGSSFSDEFSTEFN
jgi:SPP1 family predicted phage head-tail adaptor